MIVRVYWNSRRGMYSLQTVVPKKGWRVCGYATALVLTNVIFTVNTSAWKRWSASGHKNVHAFMIGTFNQNDQQLKRPVTDTIRYDLRVAKFIKRNDGSWARFADYVHLSILPNGKPLLET